MNKNHRIAFVVDEYGRATLYVDRDAVLYVDESSGYDEVMTFFNKYMKERKWNYKLTSGFPEIFKEMMEEKPND